MYCAHCGEFNDDNAFKCAACGMVLARTPDAPAPAMTSHGSPADPIKTSYLVQSILVTFFCCQPLGVVAIVYSAFALSRNSTGDYAGAAAHAARAREWCKWGFGIGLAWVFVCFAFFLINVLSS